jgi:peptidoglycan/LPS O-acetylase OafA/YrhL
MTATQQGSRIRLGHNPALDGIRGVAVSAMLLYHGGEVFGVGGFLSIDTFFVLSGYLITTLLVIEWANHGRVDLRAFWIRRAKRLLPALFLLLIGVGLYAVFIAQPTELGRIRADGLASFGYFANWRFVFSGASYFDNFAAPSPLRHLWSLAVEEQFYLVWPLLVYGVLRWRRGSARALLGLIVPLMIGSAVLMAVLHAPGTDPSRVYYGTDTRAQSLLLGAALGVVLFLHGPLRNLYVRRATQLLAVTGAAYTIWTWTSLSEHTDQLYQGGFLVSSLATALVIASVTQPDRGPLGRILSWRPITWVGEVSYGLYLWHWPLYMVVTPSRTGLDGAALLLARLGATVAIATCSFYLVEKPIRFGTFRLRWALSLTSAGAVGVILVLILTTAGAQPSIAQTTIASIGKGPPPKVHEAEQQATKVLLLGDSIVATMGTGLQRAAGENSLLVWNRGVFGCGLSRAGEVVEGGEVRQQSFNCNDWPTRWRANLDEFSPDMVVLLPGGRDLLDRRINGQWFRLGTPEHDRYFLSELDQAVELLSSRGARVVLLTMPYFSRPELTLANPLKWLEYQPWRVDRINGLMRSYAKNHDKVRIIDMNTRVSPGGKYTAFIGDTEIRPDGVHFTPQGADYVGTWLAPRLRIIATGETRTPYPGVTLR